MKVHGSCHCGQIEFEAEVDPATVGICHCTDCQKLSGSAYRVSVRAAASDFSIFGAVSKYTKTADSGNKRVHAFCPTCGTPVYATQPQDITSYTLRVGTLQEKAELVPRRQIFCQSAMGWSDDLRTIEKQAVSILQR